MTQTETTLVEVNPETGKAYRLLKVPTPRRKVNSNAVPNAQGRVVQMGQLTCTTYLGTWGNAVELFGLIFPIDKLSHIEECLDVVSNGVGTSVVIFMSDKTVKLFTSATAIDDFFKAYA